MSDEVDAYARRTYRKLITDIATELIDDDRRKLVFLHELGGELSALDIFSQLEKKGLIGPAKVCDLKSILSDIDRSDLISKHVEPFVTKQSQSVNLQGHTGIISCIECYLLYPILYLFFYTCSRTKPNLHGLAGR